MAEVAERSKYSREPSEDEGLQKASQNPIADLVSVPFQSNTNFNAGPFNRTQEILNIQPVVPMHSNENWNVISRTIIPVVSQPDPLINSSTNGIGDITQSLFLSPAHPGELIWGVGPVFTVPSASDPNRQSPVRPDGRLPNDAGTLGAGCAAQQSVVGRRQSVAASR